MSRVQDLRSITHPERWIAAPETRTIFDWLARTPLSASGEIAMVMDADIEDEKVVTACLGFWMIRQWLRSNKPIYVLDESAAFALSHTALPRSPLGKLPKLPAEGIYVSLPETFEIWNDETEMHPVEGIYLAMDRCRDAEDRSRDALVVYAIGKAKDPEPEHLVHRETMRGFSREWGEHVVNGNDAIVFWAFHEDSDVEAKITANEVIPGIAEAVRTAINLLYALERRLVQTKRVTPPLPKSPSKLKKAARKKSTLPYTVVYLNDPPKRPAQAQNGHGSPTQHVVPGHWHRYWVKNPAGQEVDEEKVLEDGTKMFLVWKWLFPYLRGTPSGEGRAQKELAPKTVLVRG